MNRKANDGQVRELLLQALEAERGGIQVYTAALKAVQNKDLRQEWQAYLDETHTHEEVLGLRGNVWVILPDFTAPAACR